MSFGSKTTSLQAYHMVLYRKPVHPELFGIEGRMQIRHGDYDFESWIFKGGHALLFQFGGQCVSEVVTDRLDGLPERGLITALPCAGERDHEEKVAERIELITSMQTETLSEHLYLSTYNEMLEHGRHCDGQMTLWAEGKDQRNLSLVDVQRFRTEVHVQGYHLRADCALVLRTQTILRAARKAKAKSN